MPPSEPVDPRVRLAISQWPDHAPRGAVTTFCLEHAISRKTFYAIRARAKTEGPAAVLEPKSRRPRSSPTAIGDDAKRQAIRVRAALEQSGLDHGPISVHEKMRSLGISPVPSTASLARIFREAGVARVEPKKKPRAAYRRFVYPAPNACWQVDATETVLTRGRKCVIFQLIDDHSRYAVASHVAWGETADAAIRLLDKGIAAHGVPQRLLSDNGSALNPGRRGYVGQLVAHVSRLGVEAITGKPYKPTTQGKNERFHQTLFRYLDKQPLADSLEQLQAQVDAFDLIYNTERPHQALPGRVTPETAWLATPKADPPRPKPDRPRSRTLPAESPVRTVPTEDSLRVIKLRENGSIRLHKVTYMIDGQRAGDDVIVIEDGDAILVADIDGTILIEHTRPAPGVKYVGNGRPRGRRPKSVPVSPMS
ncbi:integrase core domain-containing protein [Agromyces marinus]|uniref:integrase core domain-containing protein n=1 Tax=Agromyces marinus TaxID=1389020 RepID=UPI003D9B14AC|nr:IS481 family transposase ISArsp2 [Agromyces marinus]